MMASECSYLENVLLLREEEEEEQAEEKTVRRLYVDIGNGCKRETEKNKD